MTMINVNSINGKALKKMQLPEQFNEEVRPDLIKRAFNAIRSHEVQSQGVMPGAGMRHAVRLTKRRHVYKTVYGYGRSRTPRKTVQNRGTRFGLVGAQAPFTVGGRRSRAPQSIKKISEKINKKERRKAIRSAISGSKPIIIEDKFESLDSTKKLINALKSNKVEFESVKRRKSGKAKMRGRTKRYKKGPLIIGAETSSLVKAGKNLPGVEVVNVKELNIKALAPGSKAGRVTVWSESAINKLKEELLFR